ncbi:TIGR02530 family flagellar biosynthesis protein [Vibrio parahaemolyticus]|nr:TIGR02530 family flagellar biosynthesis protein [Vibrio parahaemolyticus]
MDIRIQNNYQIRNESEKQKNNDIRNSQFKDILYETIASKKEVNISNHALQRMNERGIKLNIKDIENINQAMDKLEEKGAKESLILYKDLAFIASITNRTIITSMNNSEISIITNIDSTMVVK